MFKNGMMWDLDAYKIGHMTQYPEDTEYIYSVLQLRYSYDDMKEVVVSGLQYFIKEYLCKPLTQEGVDEFISELKRMGVYNDKLDDKFKSLVDLGYLPIEIKAIPEGTIIQVPNAICTVTNTIPGFHWVVGMVETLLLKVWSPILTASKSLQYKKLLRDYMIKTSDVTDESVLDFMVHDFGSRGCSCPEQAALTGMAHAVVFRGSDTIATIPLVKEYYNATDSDEIIASIPATEHSVMCSYGMEHELEAFNAILDKYPTGLVSIVSDTYNWYNVMENFTVQLKDRIEARDGKVVFRPDSGNPIDIIVGTVKENIPYEEYDKYTSEELGGIRSLAKVFGSTVNSKGYRVLNPKVGLIYGDGMYLERYKDTLELLRKIGYSVENLVIGVGGILRDGSRDSVGAAFKATLIKRKGMEPYGIMKNPITDSKKKSFKGKIQVDEDGFGSFKTIEVDDEYFESYLQYTITNDALIPVYRDGKLIREYSWSEIKDTFSKYFNAPYYLDQEAIAKFRESIYVIYYTDTKKVIKTWEAQKWGAGELNFNQMEKQEKIIPCDIYVPYLSFKTLENLLVQMKYLIKNNYIVKNIKIGYISYSRQERETEKEPELFSLLKQTLIEGCALNRIPQSEKIAIIDIHNRDSAPAGFKLKSYLLQLLYNIQIKYDNIVLVAPDKGALKRNEELNLPIKTTIYFDKCRKDGKVTSKINVIKEPETDKPTFVILDDICDGGRTFANAAKQLKLKYPTSKVVLGVTHAILPYGVKTLVYGGIDSLFTIDTCLLAQHCGNYIHVLGYNLAH